MVVTNHAGAPQFPACQLSPPSSLLNNRVQPAAYMVLGCCGSTATVYVGIAVNPAFAALQFLPPSELLKTPSPFVPTYTIPALAGSTARPTPSSPKSPSIFQSNASRSMA